MQFLVAVILYLYYHSELSNKKQTLFLEMQNYSLLLKGDRFLVDIQTKSQNIESFTLYEDEGLYAYFPISGVEDTVLKVSLDTKRYEKIKSTISSRMIWYTLFSTMILIFVASVFSIYTLKPLRQSILFLEEFLKDMIHDLNTPVTAILLNSKLLKKTFKPERLERIELSAQTIGSLHQNLESFLRETPLSVSEVEIQSLLRQRIEYFKSIYSELSFTFEGETVVINSNEDAIRRIIDNLLSNACKYNRVAGFVKVLLDEKGFTIEDSGIGIKYPNKVFERFYKEGERGLGIGLHIVKKLCDTLGFDIKVNSSEGGSLFRVSW